MQDRDLYQQLLCLDSPWTVSQVELNASAKEVLIHVAHPRGTKFCCPDCDRRLPCYDGSSQSVVAVRGAEGGVAGVNSGCFGDGYSH